MGFIKVGDEVVHASAIQCDPTLSREDMLEAIYNKVALQDLKLGSPIKVDGKDCVYLGESQRGEYYYGRHTPGKFHRRYSTKDFDYRGETIFIGFLLNLIEEDVIEYCITTMKSGCGCCPDDEYYTDDRLIAKWDDLSEPIDKQDDECVEWVYNHFVIYKNDHY